jgi:UPF0755 protein
MTLLKKLVLWLFFAALALAAGIIRWAQQPIIDAGSLPIAFSIKAGSGTRSMANQIADAGIPVNPMLLEMLARSSRKSAKMKAGNYELKAGTTPLKLLDQLVRGEFAQESLVIIEGWTFAQMREAIAKNPATSHDTVTLSDKDLLARITPNFKMPEGLFFPDTYLFAKGSSDLQIYKQAHAMLLKRLDEGWARRDQALPYKTPYEALIMASIIEKETGQKSERDRIAGVFVNRLRFGMLLQTDPTVIYGMGDRYHGQIRKADLLRDTPYNTYTRAGLPPTPIALPGVASLTAALNPAKSDSLYFVARGDGSSQFSANLDEHNRAVRKYQR